MSHRSKRVYSESAHQGFQAVFPGTSQKMSVTATSGQSAALTKSIVRLHTTEDCHIVIGANPTALADGTCLFLPAGGTEYFGVLTPGLKIAAIRDSADGVLYMTEGA